MFMIREDDIILGQLAMARGMVSLPQLMQCVHQLNEQRALADIFVSRGLMSFAQAQALEQDLSDRPPQQLQRELEQGQTIILSQLRATRGHEPHHTPASAHPTLDAPLDSPRPHQLPTMRVLSPGLLNHMANPDRYELLSLLGKGGMGQVWLAHDRVMQREVALKTLTQPLRESEELQRQLMLEAQITGLLEHPSIVPIYELGNLLQEGPYYAMRVVREQSLEVILKEMRQGQGRYTLSQLAAILRTALLALQYAHDHGVIHRDLKPENLLIGAYGEVFVIDWGVAHVDNRKLKHRGLEPVAFPLQPGMLVGTPHYMAPEQARGDNDAIDHRTDVYAMGVVLYELLTLTPLHEADHLLALLFKAAEAPVQAPSDRAPDRDIPPVLEEICLKALAKEPADRFQSAQEMARELELYLEGIKDLQRRQRLCAEIIEQAAAYRRHYAHVQEAYARSQDELFAMQRKVQSHAPTHEKEQLWQLEQRCDDLRMEVEQAFGDTILHYGQALQHIPDHREARQALADLYWERFERAEISKDDASAAYFEGLVRQYNDGRYNTLLAGVSTLHVRTQPELAATLRLYRYERRLNRLSPVLQFTKLSPLLDEKLAHGSYLLTLEAPGYISLRVPLLLRRQQELTLNLALRPTQALPEDMVIITGGEFLSGSIQPLNLARNRKTLKDFAIMRHPVTCAQYAEFLNDRQAMTVEQALTHAPRLKVDQHTKIYFDLRDGVFCVPTEDDEGDAWDPQWPICLISYYDACAYARWRSGRDGVPMRLPTALEWEKAARGVDGRLYPWGNRFDASFCNVRESSRGRPMPVAVGTFAHDCSPYGVIDMAGNIAEWTSTWDDEAQDTKIIQGAAFALPSFVARLDWTIDAPASFPYSAYGFRLVADLS